jgi:predicted phosphohydrolase
LAFLENGFPSSTERRKSRSQGLQNLTQRAEFLALLALHLYFSNFITLQKTNYPKALDFQNLYICFYKMSAKVIDWDAKEAEMEADEKEKKKLYMREYQRKYQMKVRQERGVKYTRGPYVSMYDKLKLEKMAENDSKIEN